MNVGNPIAERSREQLRVKYGDFLQWIGKVQRFRLNFQVDFGQLIHAFIPCRCPYVECVPTVNCLLACVVSLGGFPFPIARSTLCGWLAEAAAVLTPLWQLLMARVLAANNREHGRHT